MTSRLPVLVLVLALSACASTPTASRTDAPTLEQPAASLPEPSYAPGVRERLSRQDLRDLHRMLRSLVGGAAVEAINVILIGHPMDRPAIEARLAPRSLGQRQVELTRVLVEHLAWTRRYRRSATAATPAQMAFGPFVAPTVRRCRGFELRSSYSRLAAPPLPICVEGQTTAAELDELLRRLERGDFVRKAEAGVALGVDTSHLSQITRLRCSRTADEVRFEVAYRLSRVSGAVLELVQRGLVLRLVRASVWVA